MNDQRARGSVWPRTLLVVAVLVAGLTLAGCGGVKESPGGPSGSGVPISQATAVPAGVMSTILAAVKADGVTYDPASVAVSYGMSHRQAIVTGTLRGQQDLTTPKAAGAATFNYSEIDLTLLGGKWEITSWQ